MIALGIGLAMSSKLSGALISILTAAMFLIVLIQIIRKKDSSLSIKKLLIQFAVFAVIVFPIGLFWPLFAYINYQQPILYVWTSLSPQIGVADGVTWFDKYGYFNFYLYYHYPYMVLWKSGSHLPQDYNIYDAMLKSSLFGEFSYDSRLIPLSYILITLNLLVAIAFAVLTIYLIIKFIILKNRDHKNKTKHNYLNNTIYGMAILFLIFFINYIIFTAKNPYLCSYDFRYIVPIVIPFAYFIGLGIDKISASKKLVLNKYVPNITAITVLLLAISTCVFYCIIR